MPAAWGDGYEKVIVFGKHRGAHGLVQMVVPSKAITHWRAQVVYSPSLLAKLEESRYYSWRDEAEVRHWAAMLQERVTRCAWATDGTQPPLHHVGLGRAFRLSPDAESHENSHHRPAWHPLPHR